MCKPGNFETVCMTYIEFYESNTNICTKASSLSYQNVGNNFVNADINWPCACVCQRKLNHKKS